MLKQTTQKFIKLVNKGTVQRQMALSAVRVMVAQTDESSDSMMNKRLHRRDAGFSIDKEQSTVFFITLFSYFIILLQSYTA